MIASTCVGQIVDIDPRGHALVEFPGNPHGPLPARTVVTLDPSGPDQPLVFPPVLLMFENQDARLPIIVGLVRDAICTPSIDHFGEELAATGAGSRNRQTIEARRELELRCGKSSVTLRQDGKIEFRGTDIVSRATRRNRIKGGSVAIN